MARLVRELLARFGKPLSFFSLNKHKNSLETSIESFVQLKFRDTKQSKDKVEEFWAKAKMIGVKTK